MATLEELTPGASVKGVPPNGLVTVIDIKWRGELALERLYKDAAAKASIELFFRDREPQLEIALVEQWHDELFHRFQFPFEILTNDKPEAADTGNWFQENPLAICRLNKFSRNENVQATLVAADWAGSLSLNQPRAPIAANGRHFLSSGGIARLDESTQAEKQRLARARLYSVGQPTIIKFGSTIMQHTSPRSTKTGMGPLGAGITTDVRWFARDI